MKIREEILSEVQLFIVHCIKYKVVLPRHILTSNEL